MSDTPRRILTSLDGEVRVEGLLLTCVCEGGAFERAFVHVAALAGVIALIVSGLALAGAVPWPLLSVLVVWLLGGLGALLFSTRRRPQHGTFEIDFEQCVVRHTREAREIGTYELRGEARLEPSVDETTDEELPRWLLFRLGDARRPRLLRLARAPLASLHPVLYHFRKYGLASAFPARPR